ncbi:MULTISPECIES: YkvA family protein [Bacillus]|uniref:YkvA family protein n=1 Tax=Bacillus TaxID=1386 RepID=UPI000BB99AD3|nr:MULTISPECIES: DUF1232 domain-containing protein [Bacillus]
MIDKTNSLPSMRVIWRELKELLQLAKDWKTGNYPSASRFTIFIIFVAAGYFFMPFDIIPDFLIGIGFLDDIIIISFIFYLLRNEIKRYRSWKNTHSQRDVHEK